MKGRTLVCVTAMLAAVGCGDGTGPGSLPARFDLVEMDGGPLVQVVTMPSTTPGAPDATCESRRSARLDFIAGGGRYLATSYMRLVCDDGRPDVSTARTENGRVDVSRDSVFLNSSEEHSGQSTHQWAGRRSGKELRIYRNWSGESGVLPDLEILVFRAP